MLRRAGSAPDQAGRQLALLQAPTPGLRNRTGEYNCFLNAVVQCLWRCRAFRAGLLALAPAAVQVPPSCCVLRSLMPSCCRKGICAD
jgi:hypothetical protein